MFLLESQKKNFEKMFFGLNNVACSSEIKIIIKDKRLLLDS